MAEKGLRAWVKERWVDIGAPKKDGKYQPCGRSKGSKRKYPKCVPIAKARRMSSSQKASAVRRKRAAGNPGGKPTNVATFAKRKVNDVDDEEYIKNISNYMVKTSSRRYDPLLRFTNKRLPVTQL